MSKFVSKKTRRNVAMHKLFMCEYYIDEWERWPRYTGVKPSYITEQLVWLHKWHPELRERVGHNMDRMSLLYESGAFDHFEFHQL